jgi:ABC-type sulfate/molybdate transport systems ATPase subunit
VRPHDIEVMSRRNGAPSLDAVVEFVHTAGAVAKIELRLEESGQILEAEVPRSRQTELALKPGDRAFVKFREVRTFPPAGET